jgi:hypothetical protein
LPGDFLEDEPIGFVQFEGTGQETYGGSMGTVTDASLERSDGLDA